VFIVLDIAARHGISTNCAKELLRFYTLADLVVVIRVLRR